MMSALSEQGSFEEQQQRLYQLASSMGLHGHGQSMSSVFVCRGGDSSSSVITAVFKHKLWKMSGKYSSESICIFSCCILTHCIPAVLSHIITHFSGHFHERAGRKSSGKCLEQHLRTCNVLTYCTAPPERISGKYPDLSDCLKAAYVGFQTIAVHTVLLLPYSIYIPQGTVGF